MTILILKETGAQTDADFKVCTTAAQSYSPQASIVYFGNQAVPGAVGKYLAVSAYEQRAKCLHEFYDAHIDPERAGQWQSIKRWLVFLEYARRTRLPCFFTMDSDVLLLCDLRKILTLYRDKDIALLKVYPAFWSCGAAFFPSITVLQNFVEWLFWLFTHKNEEVYRLYFQQKVNDMALWTIFLSKHQQYSSDNLMDSRNGGSFDPNLQLIDGWQNDGSSKSLTFKGGFAYGVRDGKEERLYCLHTWGIWKNRMGELWNQARKSA